MNQFMIWAYLAGFAATFAVAAWRCRKDPCVGLCELVAASVVWPFVCAVCAYFAYVDFRMRRHARRQWARRLHAARREGHAE